MTSESASHRPDVVVVGAGLIGLACALKLQQAGHRVRVVDRDAPGKGASFGNAGYLATELVDPLSTPDTLRKAPALLLDPHGPLALPPGYLPHLLPWLVRFAMAARKPSVTAGRQALAALNSQALAAWQRCLDSIGAQDELIASGYLMVWESERALARARRHRDKLDQYGIRAELLDADAVQARDSGLSRHIHHALLFPNAHQVSDPYCVVQRLVEALQNAGGEIVRESIEQIEATTEGVKLQSRHRLAHVSRVVIAAGAWSGKLAEQLGLKMPLESESGHHLTLPGRAGALRQPIGSAERNVVMTPLKNGLRVVGFSELGGLALKPNPKRSRTLKHHASALLSDASGVERASDWMGFRPTLPDSLPVIGQHPQCPHVQFAFGHQHLGLTQAAITAELVVDQTLGHTPALDLAPFRPERFTRS
ncbi:NAD(P)/FAD-dependent oxidoreductase [Chromohalobacter israelensis]|uniref:NAD(P)/FAD-dependent oxidoreductase n=1 Tax=Chromohalobacter israelensis TaxID=141390 RepID=UPI00265C1E7A|nr:FAD-dependent oxidoreductase [Chromohalobacter salexigens]MDO0944431.1 FAD-dependent oxidoreductase [Chromohalobacter salexigens]